MEPEKLHFKQDIISTIYQAERYLDNIHEFFSNMAAFFDSQIKKGQTGGLQWYC